MRIPTWQPNTAQKSRSGRQSKLSLALSSTSITPTKRSASARVPGSIVASKKHKHQSGGGGSVGGVTGREKRKLGKRSEREADGASMCEQVCLIATVV